MNKKRTNRIVAILNIILVVSIYILYSSGNYLTESIMRSPEGGKSVYNSFIIDTLLNNIQLIMTLVYSGVGIFNIICAIQNRKNKKLCFWQLAFGIHGILTAISTSIFVNNPDVLEWVDRIAFGIVPIILAIINLVLIKKNKPKVIQIISYVAVIIVVILDLLDIIGTYWNIVAVVMQLIYIHYQEKDISESNARKIINIILYYILQTILVVIFFIMLISSLIISKTNETKWRNQLSEIYNNISTMQGITNKEIYIPVEKNYKYGFINEKGEEKIACEYDRVTYFFEAEFDNKICYFALAIKDNKFYIISKSNQKLDIDQNKYLKTLDDYLGRQSIEMFNGEEDKRLAYVQAFSFILQSFTRGETDLRQQTIEEMFTAYEIDLEKQNSKLYYENENYILELTEIEDEESDEYDIDYDLIYEEPKFNVTIIKNNGEESTNIEYIPDYNERSNTIETYSDGSIGFIDLNEEIHGWYDTDGNKFSVSADYDIEDVLETKIILRQVDEENLSITYFMLDKTGRVLLSTDALSILGDTFLIKNEDKQMMLYDKDLNKISDGYDKIVPNATIDISENFSSY